MIEFAQESHATKRNIRLFLIWYLSMLDWKTPFWEVNLNRHWRIGVTLLVAVPLSIYVWVRIFPLVPFDSKLIAGYATGLGVGFFTGFIWQVFDKSRRCYSSGKLLLRSSCVFGLAMMIALFFLAPDYRAREAELIKIRGLDPNDIISISIKYREEPSRIISESEHIADFANLAKKAFLREREFRNIRFSLVINFKDGHAIFYESGIPNSNPYKSDIALWFKARYTWCDILVPNGKIWLNGIDKN